MASSFLTMAERYFETNRDAQAAGFTAFRSEELNDRLMGRKRIAWPSWSRELTHPPDIQPTWAVFNIMRCSVRVERGHARLGLHGASMSMLEPLEQDIL